MPAPIIGAMVSFLEKNLGEPCWEGEVPRQTTLGDSISIDDGSFVIRVVLHEEGLTYNPTTEDAYDDAGGISVEIAATTRKKVEDALLTVFGLLANASNWPSILDPPYEVFHLLLNRWYAGPLPEGQRTGQSNLIYRAELLYEIKIHGSVKTR